MVLRKKFHQILEHSITKVLYLSVEKQQGILEIRTIAVRYNTVQLLIVDHYYANVIKVGRIFKFDSKYQVNIVRDATEHVIVSSVPKQDTRKCPN